MIDDHHHILWAKPFFPFNFLFLCQNTSTICLYVCTYIYIILILYNFSAACGHVLSSFSWHSLQYIYYYTITIYWDYNIAWKYNIYTQTYTYTYAQIASGKWGIIINENYTKKKKIQLWMPLLTTRPNKEP